MSEDWVVRAKAQPRITDLVAALSGLADGPSTVRSDLRHRFLVLESGEDRVWVTPPRTPYAASEVTRLLHRPTAVGQPAPYWIEVNGPTSSAALVAKVAEALAAELSGVADRCTLAEG